MACIVSKSDESNELLHQCIYKHLDIYVFIHKLYTKTIIWSFFYLNFVPVKFVEILPQKYCDIRFFMKKKGKCKE